jgi:hypothetical protein
MRMWILIKRIYDEYVGYGLFDNFHELSEVLKEDNLMK